MRVIGNAAPPLSRHRAFRCRLAIGCAAGRLRAGADRDEQRRPAQRCPARARSGQRRRPRSIRQRRTPLRSRWAPSSGRTPTEFVTGVRFYKGAGNTGTHVGTPVDDRGDEPGHRHLHRRERRRVAAGDLRRSGGDLGQHHLRRVVLRTRSAGTPPTPTLSPPPGWTTRRCTRWPTEWTVPTGSTGTAPAAVSPPTPISRRTTGSTSSSTPSATDTIAPTVTGNSPAANATGVPTQHHGHRHLQRAHPDRHRAGDRSRPGPPRSRAPSAYDAPTRTVTFTPTAALAASTRAHGHGHRRQGSERQHHGAVLLVVHHRRRAAIRPARAPSGPAPRCPSTVTVNDNSAVELGVRFRSSTTSGYITGLRFYKGPSNTGTHTGSLWTNTGTRLSTVTFTGESGSGWQTATLPAPVPVTANTTYVASYHTNTGFYSANSPGGFTSAVSRGPLTALANGTDGANGVYLYGGSGFPTNTYQSSNYWVDVVFDTSAADTTAADRDRPGTGAERERRLDRHDSQRHVQRTGHAFVGHDDADRPGWVPWPARSAYDAGSSTATFTPTTALANSTAYTATVSGASRRRRATRWPRSVLVLHDRGAASAAARPGSGRSGAGDQELGCRRRASSPRSWRRSCAPRG